ncbi:MAG TPA: 50S ribosomal protein L11 methyltransferase [Bacteroidia bacterium]|jgi:ribosomal protein L11 methyltransferase|nr:50S ribosomal protein L11 methyltransferase [Bacteroidia bacterium]HMU20414.1 50S ribosomal protein L11 methyltransferase [Bacteroidia bacterium]
MNSYIAIHCKVNPVQPFSEILIAQLGEIGFEMFEEKEDGFDGFIRKENFTESLLDTIEFLQPNDFCAAHWHIEEIESQNWNDEWEKNYPPIKVKNIYVRAPFHPDATDNELEIIIQPKMAFGTGHHATTAMMMELMLAANIADKHVLDMGCGSGILAILASKLGCITATAIDNDPNCVLNSIENIENNKIRNIEVLQGDALSLKDLKFEVILANINRNILLADIASYNIALSDGGQLLVSGFLTEDVELITQAFGKYGLKLSSMKQNQNWAAMHFFKTHSGK